MLTLIFFKNSDKYSIVFFYEKNYKNHTYVYLYNNIKKFLFFFKNIYKNYFLSLIDIAGVDISCLDNYNFFYEYDDVFEDYLPLHKFFYNKMILFNLINYKDNQRIFFNLFFNNTTKLYSLEKFFLNSSWMERELSEFFKITIFKKFDSRNLLLDYNLNINPLLKSFPTEGFQEVYYNFNNMNLDYINVEFVEL